MPDIYEVNARAKVDPEGFVGECEAAFQKSVKSAAKRIAERSGENLIVLLSGPSGSGKTTTSLRLERELEKMGVLTSTVSLDNYFLTVDKETSPKNERGEIDYESPLCLDIKLLNRHMKAITRGEEVMVPKFDFKNQTRSEEVTPLKLQKNEIVIFEGIHALNDIITGSAGEHGIKLYISARSHFTIGGEPAFRGTWVRLTRRLVRDKNFRGASSDFTFSVWGGVRRGEKKYISPFRDKADIIINSTHPYEVNVLKPFFKSFITSVPQNIERYDEICKMAESINLFEDLSPDFVPKDSLLREFIGGGDFKY